MAIRVANLSITTLTQVPGVINSMFKPGQQKTFPYISYGTAMEDSRISEMVKRGQIRIDDLDTLTTYASGTLPEPHDVPPGTVVWNETERVFYRSDGTQWVSPTEGGAINCTSGVDVPAYRFVGLDATAELEISPTTTERWAGVTTEAVTAGHVGKVQSGGKALVMSATDITVGDEIVAVTGGLGATYVDAIAALGADRGADGDDDIDQTNFIAGPHSDVRFICAGDETGNTAVIYGYDGVDVIKETVELGPAGTYASTTVFTAVYGINVTAATVDTINVQDRTNADIITQIAGLAAARFYGAVEPSGSTDSLGHNVTIFAEAANTAFVLLLGTDYAGEEQYERVQMDGTDPVVSTLAFRSLDFVLLGADGIAFAAAGGEYTTQVDPDLRNNIRAYALDDQAVPGATVPCMLLPQNIGLLTGHTPVVYFTGIFTLTGGAAFEEVMIPGVAAADVVQATLVTRPGGESLIMAECTAPDEVTLTFSGDPGASTVAVTVWKLV